MDVQRRVAVSLVLAMHFFRCLAEPYQSRDPEWIATDGYRSLILISPMDLGCLLAALTIISESLKRPVSDRLPMWTGFSTERSPVPSPSRDRLLLGLPELSTILSE